MKLSRKRVVRVVPLLVFQAFTMTSVRAQAPLENQDSASFHMTYDSLLNKAGTASLVNGKTTIVYYFRWNSGYGGGSEERFGIVSFWGDSVNEIYSMRPYQAGGMFEPNITVNEFRNSSANYSIDKSAVRYLSRLPILRGYYTQPSVVDGKYRYPLNVIRLFVIFVGRNEKMGFAKHGRQEVATGALSDPQDFTLFFNWLFDFDVRNNTQGRYRNR